jgi:hypothetical protein
LWRSARFTNAPTENRAVPHLNGISFPAPSVEYAPGAMRSVFHHVIRHPLKYLYTTVYVSFPASSSVKDRAKSLLYFIGALLTPPVFIGFWKVIIMVFGYIILNVAPVLFPAVSKARNV